MSLPVPTEQTHLSHPKYRADIDGLRAIAVLSVVGFHAFPDSLKGGFVGVDIFFVISGFLISSIILGSLSKGTFSFAEFYARRIKRIFPALIVVMAACYVFGWFDLLPKEYAQLGQHIAGGAAFISNFLLWQEVGYFDNLAETKPLLHLWSLGIEEQYYIVWPLLLFLAYRWRFNFLILATFIIAISFTANINLSYGDRTEAFFSPLTRFWELLIGSLLAYLVSQKQCLWTIAAHKLKAAFSQAVLGRSTTAPDANLVRNTQSLLGALLIVCAVLLIDKTMAFPGWWALLPTVGAYLIIAAGQHAWINRTLLSHRLLVWFGLISFPLYLWHWPLLSFARITEAATPAISIRLSAIALAILLAWLTYRLVEHPMRFGKQWDRAKVLTLSLLMVALAAIGYDTYVQNGLLQRVSSQRWQGTVMRTTKQIPPPWAQWNSCGIKENEYNESGITSGCRILNPEKLPDVAALGDSHAMHLIYALEDIYGLTGKNIVIRAKPRCNPFFKDGVDNTFNDRCDGFMGKALNEVISSPTIKTIILANRAAMAETGANSIWPLFQQQKQPPQSWKKKRLGNYKHAMYFTLQRLVASNKEVIFVVGPPDFYFDPEMCVAVRPYYLPGHKLKTPCAITRREFDERYKDFHNMISEARAEFPTVKFIDAYQFFCDKKYCHALIDGELLYRDNNHFNGAGSRYFAKKAAKQFLE